MIQYAIDFHICKYIFHTVHFLINRQKPSVERSQKLPFIITPSQQYQNNCNTRYCHSYVRTSAITVSHNNYCIMHQKITLLPQNSNNPTQQLLHHASEKCTTASELRQLQSHTTTIASCNNYSNRYCQHQKTTCIGKTHSCIRTLTTVVPHNQCNNNTHTATTATISPF